MRAPRLVLLAASALLACGASLGEAPGEDPNPPTDLRPSSARLAARPLGSTSAPSGFQEYLPPDYDDLRLRPLLVFLHGVGENGNGGSELGRVLAAGPPRLIARDLWRGDRPFVVLAPQHVGGGCPSAAEVHAFLSWASSAYRIDPRRVYLTGLSCGAIGAWSYLGVHGGSTVAAALLLAGDPGDPNQSWSAWGRQGCALGGLALWAVHGTADDVVTISNERTTLQRLAACPAPRRDAVFTEVVGAGHDVWSSVYDCSSGTDAYAWLLARPKP